MALEELGGKNRFVSEVTEWTKDIGPKPWSTDQGNLEGSVVLKEKSLVISTDSDSGACFSVDVFYGKDLCLFSRKSQW